MKVIFLIFIFIFISSCSKVNKVRTSVKLKLGALATTYTGGIFINSINTSNGTTAIFTADENGVVDIPFGTYKFMVIAFSGPGAKEGNLVCGATAEQTLNATESTVSVNVSNTNCADQNFINFINNILNTNVALWDQAMFDNSKWGP